MTGPTRLRVFLRNAAFLFGERGLRMAAAFVGWVLIARALDPAAFGQLALAFSFLGVFAIVAALGTEHVTLAAMSKADSPAESARHLLNNVFVRLGAALLIVVVVGSATSGGLLSGEFSAYLAIVVLAVPAVALEAFELHWIAAHQSQRAMLARTLTALVGLLAKIFALQHGWSATAFAWLLVGEVWLFALICGALGHGVVRQARQLLPSLAELRGLLRASWPYCAAALLVAIQLRADQVLVWRLLSEETLGAYMVAIRVMDGLYVAGSVLAAALFSRVAQGRTDGPPADESAEWAFAVLSAGALLTLLGVLALAGAVVPLLFGDAFGAAAWVLQVLVLGLPFTWTGMLAVRLLVLHGVTQLAIVRAAVAMASCLGFAWFGGVMFGLPGIAGGVVIGHLCGSFFVFRMLRGTRRLFATQARGMRLQPVVGWIKA